MKITSNASWTKINDSFDIHNTVKTAEAVCKMLKEDYSDRPCEIRGFCEDAWVEIDGTRQGCEVK